MERSYRAILLKLGYREKLDKPKLFWKFNEGYIYADMRKSLIVNLYSYEVNFEFLLREYLLISRNGLDINCDFNSDYHCPFSIPPLKDPNTDLCYEQPSGYCKICGVDFIDDINFELLDKARYDFIYVDLSIELYYCKTCRDIQYKVRWFKDQHFENNRKCRICGEKRGFMDRQLSEHHISYQKNENVLLCEKCHGKVHGAGFPNPLWEDKK